MRNYQTTKNHIEAFENKTGKKYRLTEIDLNFYDAFVRYMVEKPSKVNTIFTHIKNIKVFLTDAFDHGVDMNLDFRKRPFKTVSEEIDAIYLTTSEIDSIAGLELSANLKYDRVRDWFLVGCLTGLRYSDYHQLRKENLNPYKDTYILKIRMVKTDVLIAVPLKPQVLDILKKYN